MKVETHGFIPLMDRSSALFFWVDIHRAPTSFARLNKGVDEKFDRKTNSLYVCVRERETGAKTKLHMLIDGTWQQR